MVPLFRLPLDELRTVKFPFAESKKYFRYFNTADLIVILTAALWTLALYLIQRPQVVGHDIESHSSCSTCLLQTLTEKRGARAFLTFCHFVIFGYF